MRQRTAAVQPSPSLRGFCASCTSIIVSHKVRAYNPHHSRRLRGALKFTQCMQPQLHCALCVQIRCRFLRDVERHRELCQTTPFANVKYCLLGSLLMRPDTALSCHDLPRSSPWTDLIALEHIVIQEDSNMLALRPYAATP